MKKLSELVNYKNELDKLSVDTAKFYVNVELSKFTHLINDAAVDEKLNLVNQSLTEFDGTITKIRNDLKLAISEAERPWFQESYELYEGEINSNADTILNLRKSNDFDTEWAKTRLCLYADWHYPAMIIRPGLESFVETMVAYDPLYLVDIGHDYLLPALSKFNTQYQSRLRSYTINESNEIYLDRIPNNQFGMVFAYNYFNFRPFDVLKKYLDEIYQKLKPGGMFIMTFNDCDRASAVKLVENYYCCYTPGYLVKELAQSMGYEIHYSWNDDGPTTWLELKKPGTLSSLKGGQTLAKILPKQL